MDDKKLSAGEVGLEVVGYTAQQDIDWQGDCSLRKAPMLDYSIPLVRLSDAQRLLAAARLQTAMLATCAKNVADERDQLRALLAEQPQATRWADGANISEAPVGFKRPTVPPPAPPRWQASAAQSAPVVQEGLSAVLEEYARQTKALPAQHEIPERGCSTYNWRMSVIRDLRAMLAAAGGRK